MHYPIRRVRQQMDLLKSEFAILLGIDLAHLKELELGQTSMTAADKTAFAAQGIDADQLEADHIVFVGEVAPMWA